MGEGKDRLVWVWEKGVGLGEAEWGSRGKQRVVWGWEKQRGS